MCCHDQKKGKSQYNCKLPNTNNDMMTYLNIISLSTQPTPFPKSFHLTSTDNYPHKTHFYSAVAIPQLICQLVPTKDWNEYANVEFSIPRFQILNGLSLDVLLIISTVCCISILAPRITFPERDFFLSRSLGTPAARTATILWTRGTLRSCSCDLRLPFWCWWDQIRWRRCWYHLGVDMTSNHNKMCSNKVDWYYSELYDVHLLGCTAMALAELVPLAWIQDSLIWQQ